MINLLRQLRLETSTDKGTSQQCDENSDEGGSGCRNMLGKENLTFSCLPTRNSNQRQFYVTALTIRLKTATRNKVASKQQRFHKKQDFQDRLFKALVKTQEIILRTLDTKIGSVRKVHGADVENKAQAESHFSYFLTIIMT